ncbi:hypothetical protein [Actinoplanes sp. NPDC051851]|uniref:hypothetical protein n=1 Tax=Actinoplanes sp. NPDC051851 TaxID=3154753 RepID=UPI003432A86A
MLRLSRPAMALATASITAGVLFAPAAAYADDITTQLSATEMHDALTAVSVATGKAQTDGYAGTYTGTDYGQKMAGAFEIDRAHGTGHLVSTGAYPHDVYGAAKRGIWIPIEYFPGKAASAATTAGYPNAAFVLVPQTTLTVDGWAAEYAMIPSAIVVEESRHAGTKVAHEDGSAAYTFTLDEEGEKLTLTFDTDATGVLTGAQGSSGENNSQDLDFHYGAQTVTLPGAGTTIGQDVLIKALAYQDMSANVRSVAQWAASDVRSGAKGKAVKLAELRKTVRADVAGFNTSVMYKVITATNVSGGVKIHAKNPYNGVAVAYTIKASGKKVLVKKA